MTSQEGADPNRAEPQHGYTALHLSPSAEMTALLLRYKADTQKIDRKGDTPLHVACFNGRSDIVSLLIVNGCDVNAQNKPTGFAPIHVAAFSGHVPSLTELLSAKADFSLLDNSGNTPLHVAASKNHLEAVSFLASQPGAPLNTSNKAGFTVLRQACCNARLGVVRVLLEKNADFNPIDQLVQHHALWRPSNDVRLLRTLLEFGWPVAHLVLTSAAQDPAIDPLTILLDAGCDVNESFGGTCPLHVATRSGYTTAISLLAAEGANLEATDAAGCTPLHLSAKLENALGLNRLITLGANVNAVNKAGQTPLHIAAHNMRITSNIIATLVQKGGNIHIRDKKGQSALDLFEAACGYVRLRSHIIDHYRQMLATTPSGV